MIENVFARYLAMLAIGGSLLGGAAIGLAGMASAATDTQATSGYDYAPTVKAHPAPTQKPGWHNHHGVWHIEGLGK